MLVLVVIEVLNQNVIFLDINASAFINNCFCHIFIFLGLGFRPMPPESNVESTLIWYKSSDRGNIEYWQKELKKFLTSK